VSADAATDGADAGTGPADAAASCNAGCASTHCFVTLATSQPGASALAIDGTSVYWTTNSGPSPSRVMKVGLSGGVPVQLASLEGPIWALAVNGTSVYFTNGRAASTSVSIESMPLAGGAPTTLISGQSAQVLALDSANMYWTNQGTGTNGTVMKMPLDGGSPTTLASGQAYPNTIAVDATSAYWTNAYEFTGSINTMVSSVMRVSLNAGATPVMLASDQYLVHAIVSDGTSAFWVTEYGTVVREPVAGGPTTVFASGQDQPIAVALDATNVYWANQGTGRSGSIGTVPQAGGATVLLYQSEEIDSNTGGEPIDLAVDATSVYWTDPTVGTVNKMCK